MTWIEECQYAAKLLSKSKQQEFLMYMWAGQTVQQSARLARITSEASIGIISSNAKRYPELMDNEAL